MLFGGMAHRRAENVAKQVDELGDAIEAVEEPAARGRGAPVARRRVPGMPLPTGYGLQVRGPDDESIVLPVCLPPGFELASMVLCPEFLPRDQPAPQPVPRPLAAPGAGTRAAPAAGTRRDPRTPQRHAPVRLRQRPGLQRRRDVRRHRRGRRGETAAAPRASRRTTSEAVARPDRARAAGRLCAYDPPDAARSRDRTRGGTARRFGRSVRPRPGAQARAVADRGDPVDPTPNHDRGRLDRHDSALFSPRCTRTVPRRGEVRFRVHTSAARCARRSSPPAGTSCATSASSRIRAAGSSRAGTAATRRGTSRRTAPTG